MQLSELACEILEIFRQNHRRPGARLTFGYLRERLGSEPTLTAAASELTDAGYVIAPDADTIELTARGFDTLQRENYGSTTG
ncbi:hypothetical protein [Methylobacterium nodulans]|uniref:Uncharacterized protein n=1 Tax=Methylobacterium nodulans (strain LMG 21967 / CNCM I-2342 / ORS 2060) TaxID=460265 RepID=B8IU82_METNO|nr:hypothetical protein [Methylobacterium nodulans]ACL55127.1 hypothetical protein Mnod_0077 [Methylobacterium nodulans ORS 2060]